jgi:hypothetical protein
MREVDCDRFANWSTRLNWNCREIEATVPISTLRSMENNEDSETRAGAPALTEYSAAIIDPQRRIRTTSRFILEAFRWEPQGSLGLHHLWRVKGRRESNNED